MPWITYRRLPKNSLACSLLTDIVKNVFESSILKTLGSNLVTSYLSESRLIVHVGSTPQFEGDISIYGRLIEISRSFCRSKIIADNEISLSLSSMNMLVKISTVTPEGDAGQPIEKLKVPVWVGTSALYSLELTE